jgi:hypothetical protein
MNKNGDFDIEDSIRARMDFIYKRLSSIENSLSIRI